MKASEIIKFLEIKFPPAYQESYDNAGLNTGDPKTEISGVLCCIDITHEIIDEAIAKNANMIVSHHPLIFHGLKSLSNKTLTEELVVRAIKNDLVIYCMHTNIDNLINGVNSKICEKLQMKNCSILSPLQEKLLKLVVFVPDQYAKNVRDAIFNAGAGMIGNYDSCSFNINGEGTFRGNELTNPFAGEKGELHTESEIRIETILPAFLSRKVVSAIIKAHPYEEVAYDLYPLKNEFSAAGAGMIGELPAEKSLEDLLSEIKTRFNANGIRYTGDEKKRVKRIAVCGGSGSFLINEAKKHKADVFITADVKYHQFFEPDNTLSIIDIGHYESEQFTKEIFYGVLTKNLSKFAVHLSEINSNPIKYY